MVKSLYIHARRIAGPIGLLAVLVTPTFSGEEDMESDSRLELKSGANRLALDPDTGRVSLLTRGDRPLVAQSRGEGPLRLHLPLPDYEAHMVEAHQTRPLIEAIPNGFICTYEQLSGKRGALPIKAVMKVIAVGDGSFELSCSVQNDSDTTIPQVFFPWIGGFTPIDGPDKDAVTFGKSQLHPWKRWPKQKDYQETEFMGYLARPAYSIFYGHPYFTGMKWMDYGGESMGFPLYSKDTGALSQSMAVSMEKRGGDAVDLAWYYYPFINPGQSWQSGTFVLFPHEGDWRWGVMKFKEFADEAFQPVPSTPVLEENIGLFSLWMIWPYQDWQDPPRRFTDIPTIAAEASEAGLSEMTLIGVTGLKYNRMSKIHESLGSDAELKDAVGQARKLRVNITPLEAVLKVLKRVAEIDLGRWARRGRGARACRPWSSCPTLATPQSNSARRV